MTEPQPTHRGMSTVVSHVLSVGITVILIMGLMTGATGFLDDHSERTAEEELETIGNRLAAELDEADTLGRGGDNVSLTTTAPDRVAGSTYTVQLRNGTAADDCSDVATMTCLHLSATEYSHRAVVPVNNKTTLSVEETTSGRYVITSEGGDDATQAPTRSIDLSSRVGIGGDVGAGPPIGVGTSLEQKPIPQFTFRPGNPRVDDAITFDASDSSDPDGTVEWYEWDFDNDGSFEVNKSDSNPRVDHSFTDGGWQNVTLRVKDDTGATATLSRELRVSGLTYDRDDPDHELQNATGSSSGVTFVVTNDHTRDIEIERILIDPESPSLNEVSNDGMSGTSNEIEIVSDDDDGFVNWYGGFGSGLDVPPDGAIVDIDRNGDTQNGNVVLVENDTASITVRDFNGNVISPTPEKFTFGIRYRIGDRTGATVFNDTVEVRSP